MPARDRRPVVRAPEKQWQRLGELLQLRRAELGYRRRPAFVAEREINIRLVTDIENAYRPNTFLTPTLRDIAQAYAVTYESMIAVLQDPDASLAPVRPGLPFPAGAGDSLPAPPESALVREDAARSYATVIWERLLDLADRGIRDPSGAQLGLSPADAGVWDGTAGAMPRGDRVWLVADVQCRRAASTGAGASSA